MADIANVATASFRPQWLTIEGHETKDRNDKNPSKFEAMFNPESIAIEMANTYEVEEGIGIDDISHRAVSLEPAKVSFTLTLSDTGVERRLAANKDKIITVADIVAPVSSTLISLVSTGVSSKVGQFLSLTLSGYSKTHRPLYLRLLWGQTLKKYRDADSKLYGGFETVFDDSQGFDCLLESVNVNYTQFDRLGNPLRAELETSFIEDNEPKELDFQSPDITHAREIKTGDSLPLIVEDIYKDPSYYMKVAEANKLDSVRNIMAGNTLVFPPIEK